MRVFKHEARMAPLCRCRTVWCVETVRIHELLPGHLMAGVRQIEVPRNVADQFADIHRGMSLAARDGPVESSGFVPQIRLHQRSQPVRLGSKLEREVLFVGPDPSCDVRRSEEHTSELQSRRDLVCRLLLEK